jgi:hypothetical protein
MVQRSPVYLPQRYITLWPCRLIRLPNRLDGDCPFPSSSWGRPGQELIVAARLLALLKRVLQ